MCECIKASHVIAGWKCCHCLLYNGMQRQTCRSCEKERCKPLLPDSDTGEKFESYEEAYADNPSMLTLIYEQLKNAQQSRT
jgi:hypothetical protein